MTKRTVLSPIQLLDQILGDNEMRVSLQLKFKARNHQIQLVHIAYNGLIIVTDEVAKEMLADFDDIFSKTGRLNGDALHTLAGAIQKHLDERAWMEDPE